MLSRYNLKHQRLAVMVTPQYFDIQLSFTQYSKEYRGTIKKSKLPWYG